MGQIREIGFRESSGTSRRQPSLIKQWRSMLSDPDKMIALRIDVPM